MKILETRRLVLRHLVLADLDDLYALYRDPEIRKYFPDGVQTLAETREELEWFLNGHPSHPELGLWATLLKEDNKFIGRCGLLPWTIEGRAEVEVAYMIAKQSWGKGLGTEAALAIRDYAFDQLHLTRLICLIDAGNLASIRVATKIGMKFEKNIVDKYGPARVYAIQKTGISSGAS